MRKTGPAQPAAARAEDADDYRDRPRAARDPGVDPCDDAAADTEGIDPALDVRFAEVAAALHGERLDKVLVGLAPEFSRSHLQNLLARGHVTVDGLAETRASRRVRAGQQLRIELVPTDESRSFRAQAMALAIVFEDEHLLVIDKPAGLVVHPAPGNWSGTLLNGLLAHHEGAFALPRGGIVHRLDKDTSGLMVVGKTLPAVTALARAIAAREVHRQYQAIAHGTFAEARRTIEAPIGRDPVSRVRMAVVASGRAARTDVERVGCRDDLCALRCILHTGRTHQIRVHLAWAGHPLVADAVYGGRPALGLTRQALHAQVLRLRHPASGAGLAFEVPAPPDLARAWHFVAGHRG